MNPVSSERGPAKIRALVVDDEPLARSNVVVLLRLDPEIEMVSECGSGVEALAEIRSRKPDLVFLDVQMPECDGFDVLEMLGGDLPPAVVFVTAYDQYALRAFEAGALDYLLKPFDNARFERALGRAKERIRHGKEQPKKMERLAIKNAGQVSFLKISEIDWIEAADYYACLHLGPKSHLLRRRIADLEQELVVRILAHGALDELHDPAAAFQFLQQEHLMDVFTGQPVRRGDEHAVETCLGDLVAQAIQTGALERGPAIIIIAKNLVWGSSPIHRFAMGL